MSERCVDNVKILHIPEVGIDERSLAHLRDGLQKGDARGAAVRDHAGEGRQSLAQLGLAFVVANLSALAPDSRAQREQEEVVGTRLPAKAEGRKALPVAA